MKRGIIFTLIVLGILFCSSFGLYQLMNATRFQLLGEIIPRVETPERIVALTFDDGPNGQTDEILKILAGKNVSATFYLIGAALHDYPEEAKKLAAAGHELGNHSYSHQRMIFKTPTFVRMEVERTNEEIRMAGYQGNITFRPPYGKKLIVLPWYLAQRNIQTITWDVDPLQELPPSASAQTIRDFVAAQTKPGSIILIHPWYGETNHSREAIPLIIDELQAQGYRFVRVSELLEKK